MAGMPSSRMALALSSLSAGHKTLVAFCALFIALFHAGLPFYRTSKQRSWILTGLGSAAMTVTSLPFLFDLVRKRGDVALLMRARWLSETACRAFQAYLLSDLLMGTIYYRDRVTIIMGWVHHQAYFILIHFVISWNWTHIFMLAAFMEAPTFFLAISSIYPSLRHDILFSVLFFSTRIVFHVVLFTLYLLPTTRHAAVGGSFWPAGLFALAFPMHVIWFAGSIKGFVKRARIRAVLAAANHEGKSVEVVVKEADLASSTESFVSTSSEAETQEPLSLSRSLESHKPYPPTTHTLPTTPTRHRFHRTPRHSGLPRPASPATPQRPGRVQRRRSFRDDGEEAVRRLVQFIGEAFPPARAPVIAVRGAVAVGRGMRDAYREFRDGHREARPVEAY